MGTSMTLLSGNLDLCPRSSTPPGGCWCQCYCFFLPSRLCCCFCYCCPKSLIPPDGTLALMATFKTLLPTKGSTLRGGAVALTAIFMTLLRSRSCLLSPIDNLSHFVRRAQKQFAGSNFEEAYVKFCKVHVVVNEVQRVVINQIYSLRKFTQNIFFFSQTNVENFSSLKNPVKLLILQTIRIPKDQLQYFKRYEKSAKSCRFVQLPLTHDLEILDPEIVPVNFGSKKS